MFFGMLGIYLKAVITEVALSGRLEPQSCFPESCFDGLLSIIFSQFFHIFSPATLVSVQGQILSSFWARRGDGSQ